MKKSVSCILFLCMVVSSMITSYAASENPSDFVKTTNVHVYVDGIPVPAGDLNGKTVIFAEDLENYGFSIGYDDQIRTLFVTKTGSKQDDFNPVINEDQAGEIYGPISESDIQVIFNSVQIPAYAVNGKMAVAVEDLISCRENNVSVYKMSGSYNDENREWKLSTTEYSTLWKEHSYDYWKEQYDSGEIYDNCVLLTDDVAIHYFVIENRYGAEIGGNFTATISYKDGASINLKTLPLHGINMDLCPYGYDKNGSLSWPSFRESDEKGKVIFRASKEKYYLIDVFTMEMSELDISELKDINTKWEDGNGEKCPSDKYEDLDASRWYHDAVDYVLQKSYFQGVDTNKFAPEDLMNRAMFVTVLSRMDGIDTSQYAGSDFTDVEENKWYSAAVKWAAENNIVNGTGDGLFDPMGNITREQMTAIMYRYANYKKIDTSGADSEKYNAFADKDKVSDWASDSMIWAVGNGIINGTDIGLEPKSNAVRVQVAQIVMNYDRMFSA